MFSFPPLFSWTTPLETTVWLRVEGEERRGVSAQLSGVSKGGGGGGREGGVKMKNLVSRCAERDSVSRLSSDWLTGVEGIAEWEMERRRKTERGAHKEWDREVKKERQRETEKAKETEKAQTNALIVFAPSSFPSCHSHLGWLHKFFIFSLKFHFPWIATPLAFLCSALRVYSSAIKSSSPQRHSQPKLSQQHSQTLMGIHLCAIRCLL